MGQICCKCGKGEEEEKIVAGFCLSCYADEFPLIHSFPEKKLTIIVCKLCGDLYYRDEWVEAQEHQRQIVREFLEQFISKTKKVPNTELVATSEIPLPPHESPESHKLLLLFEGSPHPDVPPYQEEKKIILRYEIGVCQRCAKYTRGYYESIVQIRGDQRKIKPYEQREISNLINQKKQEMLNGDRMAYISKTVDQVKGGIDLYIGSENFAKNLARFIADRFAASLEYSKKLKSMKDGKHLYTTTYCVRIPYFEIGDIVKYQKGIYQIIDVRYGRVVLYDFSTQETKTLSVKESTPDHITVIKKSDQLQKYIIMNILTNKVSLMNKVTFETVEVKLSSIFKDHSEGDEIVMVELDSGLFECHQL
ncbi:MAG: NMD3-related protein [Asgard group archaeon]|nr:NMD3-related protein [Asgard group archaeon]